MSGQTRSRCSARCSLLRLPTGVIGVAHNWHATSPGTVRGEAQKGFVALKVAVPSSLHISAVDEKEAGPVGVISFGWIHVGRHARDRVQLNAVVVGLVVLIGVIVGAGVGGLWDRGGCNALTCTKPPFDWHAATKAGLYSAMLALATGYVAVVGVRAFVHFAEAGRPVEK
jgi:hypothetical protein